MVYVNGTSPHNPEKVSKDYTTTLRSSLQKLEDLVESQKNIILDGNSLDLSSAVAVANYGSSASITETGRVIQRMNTSVELLNRKLEEGEVVYGVTTGYGGSADTRTDSYADLQKALMQHQASAIVLPTDRGLSSPSMAIDSLKSHAMPVPLVRAAMLIRCNSLLRGHSAARPTIVKNILTLLAHNMTPVIPLRGSISASGDLCPLSYIAGALEGNPGILINLGREQEYRVIPSNEALAQVGLEPLELQAKEGLAILNGTAFSCGAASLVLSEANQLLLMSQVLTAMGTEALLGNRSNYDPLIANARPHPGQTEVAANIFQFLAGSKLISEAAPGKVGNADDPYALAQDRYALRTSSQWVGPQIENNGLSLSQLEIELNSTTDNPLFDPDNGEVHHGGNFQAASVTSAMEKTMTTVQFLGKMIFQQCSELINPAMSKGLTPNLCIDDPSVSFSFKGIDINMAAYMSELGYLTHPVSNYVQSAEMHNQGINSLALIAARYTGDAVEVLSLMSAAYLYTLCQALDLRVVHLEFVKRAYPQLKHIALEQFGPEATSIVDLVWAELMSHWFKNASRDLGDRAHGSAMASTGRLLVLLTEHGLTDASSGLLQWKAAVAGALIREFDQTRADFLKAPNTKDYLCRSSLEMYSFVRDTLEVPIHQGLVDHATVPSKDGRKSTDKPLIGTQVGKVYSALREGKHRAVLLRCFTASGL